ncbi:cysteine desulfurase family protein [Jeotgalibaca ciconiae]|uniref:cysteine desulfurase n=1 Tax=Jeotgalibaca ciconiae TaxID=2496265 RepID=A0A3Q9BLF0_9LACT|nr:cysteine desulfurase family protein [Jeotgalibaca ciconiae]AZP05140.1 cysteine desulfurase [Jeotgalibaca ciconiae]HJB23543.1 cysteine desulfurase [Candidatus Jeotgalibaca pullicola]
MIYLDHAATTPIDADVVVIIEKALRDQYGNPSSLYQKGREARKVIEDARKIFARSIQAQEKDLIITSGASESNNTAIIGTALALQEKGKHLITTAVEHHSVLHPMQYLEKLGFEVTYLAVDETARVTAQQVEEALRPDTILVSVIYGNNEVGSINPIEEIGSIVANHSALFHTDAVQVYGSKEINVEKEKIDLLSVTAHKLNGPKGIGFLYRRNNYHLPNYIHGGTQENDHRAGTENTPYIAGFAQAVENMLRKRDENNQQKEELKSFFLQELTKREIAFSVNGMESGGLPHILNLYLPGIQSDKFLIQCDLNDIFISAGSACTAGSLEPSHVLSAMFGKNSRRIVESIRVSFGSGNTKEEILLFVDLIERIQKRK